MTIEKSTPEPVVLVAIDVAKDCHEALIEAPSWRTPTELTNSPLAARIGMGPFH